MDKNNKKLLDYENSDIFYEKVTNDEPSYVYETDEELNINKKFYDYEKKLNSTIIEYFQCKILGPIFLVILFLW